MKYLLDTDHISILQRASGVEYATLAGRIAQHPQSDFALPIVSFHEQILGAHTLIAQARTTASAVRGYALLGEILNGFLFAPVLPFDAAAGARFDALKRQRLRVATMDLRIASIALSRGLVLLTRNAADFGRIPGLVIEDWTH
ncbi:MAG TPA: type II toxin-antitoxin system VapC family toxin [Planctomycetaceae bacterium]|nr:type II toxin-antitoxin system VapC family toxin [Planctomycetaceae bacterium]